jgi:hypothetical protein
MFLRVNLSEPRGLVQPFQHGPVGSSGHQCERLPCGCLVNCEAKQGTCPPSAKVSHGREKQLPERSELIARGLEWRLQEQRKSAHHDHPGGIAKNAERRLNRPSDDYQNAVEVRVASALYFGRGALVSNDGSGASADIR